MLDFLNAPQLRDTICASFTSPFPTTFPPRFILTRPLVLSKNTSTSRPLNSLPRYLPSRPKQPLWVLTFQTQSFQSCSLAVIFIFPPPPLPYSTAARCTLSSIWSRLPPAPTAFFNIPSSAPFFSIPPTIFTHQPLSSLVSCLPSWRHKQPPYPLSLPSLQPFFWLITSLWLCFYSFIFAHFPSSLSLPFH